MNQRTRIRARVDSRNTRLQSLGFKSYTAYLDSAAWSAKKAEYRQSDLPQDCGLCGEEEGLQLHHMTYERVGREDLSDLTPLCRRCHNIVHELERRGEIELDFKGLVSAKRAMRYKLEDRAFAERKAKAAPDPNSWIALYARTKEEALAGRRRA